MPMKKEHLELCKNDDWMKRYGMPPKVDGRYDDYRLAVKNGWINPKGNLLVRLRRLFK
jgi:hypothetical protein